MLFELSESGKGICLTLFSIEKTLLFNGNLLINTTSLFSARVSMSLLATNVLI